MLKVKILGFKFIIKTVYYYTGVEYIVQYIYADASVKYECKLCRQQFNFDELIEHLLSRKHRLSFVVWFYAVFY